LLYLTIVMPKAVISAV